MIFAVTSDIIEVCKDECGTPIEGLSYFVLAEDESGRRWAHRQTYLNGTKHFDDEDGIWFFRRDEGEAEAKAQRVCDRITAAVANGTSLDLENHWVEIDPAYGSAAYQGLDAGYYFRDREIMEARERGEPGADAVNLMGGYFG